MADNGVDLFAADSPVRLTLNDTARCSFRAAGRRQPGRRPALAAVVTGTRGGLGLPAQPTSAGAGRQRLRRRAVRSAAASASRSARRSMTVGAEILDELHWRGLIAQSTDLDALAAEAARGPITLYAGFDPTAPSLHAGHLVPLLALRRFQRGRTPPYRPRRRRNRPDRRPSRHGRTGAQHRRHCRRNGPTRIRGQLERFVDFDASPTGADRREQPRVDQRDVGNRVAARRRQTLLGQRDAGPGHHPAPPGGRGDLLHGVQLHAVAGQRLRRAAPAPSAACCRSADPTSGATSSPACGWCARSWQPPCTPSPFRW